MRKEAFHRSYDLLAMITYDPKVAALVYAGLEKHFQTHEAELPTEELEEFENFETKKLQA